MTKEMMKEFKELCEPLQEWLLMNKDPYTKIIIDKTSAEVLYTECFVINRNIKNRG